MGVSHGFENNETATMFFLKKPSLVMECFLNAPLQSYNLNKLNFVT